MSPASVCLGIVLLIIGVCSQLPPSGACPSVCRICFKEFMFCQQGGLDQLPQFIPEGTKKINFEQHRFTQAMLSARNFTAYSSQQGVEVEKLWIRNCSIVSMEAHTFSGMRQLRWLDLSDNALSRLKAWTFAGLNLSSLNLDKNGGLALVRESFGGLTVRVLSLRECRMKVIQVDALLTLVPGLRTVHLEDNAIAQLTVEFQQILHQVPTVSLSLNPFHCDCAALWLMKSLAWKVTQKTEELDDEDVVGEVNWPECATPDRLRNFKLHKLSRDEVRCDPPSLHLLDIQWIDADTARLSCGIASTSSSPYSRVRWLSNNAELTAEPTTSNATYASILSSPQNNVSFRCLAEDLDLGDSVQATIHFYHEKSPNISPTQLSSSTTHRPSPSEQEHAYTSWLQSRFTFLQLLLSIIITIVVTLLLLLVCFNPILQKLCPMSGQAHCSPRMSRVTMHTNSSVAPAPSSGSKGSASGRNTVPTGLPSAAQQQQQQPYPMDVFHSPPVCPYYTVVYDGNSSSSSSQQQAYDVLMEPILSSTQHPMHSPLYSPQHTPLHHTLSPLKRPLIDFRDPTILLPQ